MNAPSLTLLISKKGIAMESVRFVVIVIEGYSYGVSFDSDKVKDSEALHSLLIFVDPGDEYAVIFTNNKNNVNRVEWIAAIGREGF